MGCGSTRAAVAPQNVFSDLVPVQGSVSAAVPQDAKRGWEEAAADGQVDEPSDQLKEEKVLQLLAELRKKLEDHRPSPPDSDMLPPPEFPSEKKREDPHRHEDVAPQGPHVAAIHPGGEQQEDHGGKESSPKKSGRIHTFEDLPVVEQVKDQNVCLNDNVVPEPLNLKDYESFKYNPTREHFAEGHPLAPCWPSHQQHIKRIAKHLNQFAKFPDKFTDLVMHRRSKLSKKNQKLPPPLSVEGGEN